MTSRDAMRHILPPALSLLLSMGIIGILHKEGLAQLKDARNLAAFAPMVLALSVSCWWLFRPRPSGVQSDSGKPSQIWSLVAPLIAFLAGPGIVTLLWAVVVYGVEREHYVTTHERIDELMAALPIGLVVGLLAGLAVFAYTVSSD